MFKGCLPARHEQRNCTKDLIANWSCFRPQLHEIEQPAGVSGHCVVRQRIGYAQGRGGAGKAVKATAKHMFAREAAPKFRNIDWLLPDQVKCEWSPAAS